jgi:hypothetical protein
VSQDPDSAVQLDGFWLEFRTPDTLVTNFWGVATAAWPDIDFTATVSDRFHIGGGDEGGDIVQVETRTTQDADVTILNILSGVLSLGGLVLAGTLSGWFAVLILPAIGFEVEAFIAATKDPSLPTSPGQFLISSIPRHQLVAGGLKLVFDYKRVHVDGTGVSAGAGIVPAQRVPRVDIAGPRELTARIPRGIKPPPQTLKAGGTFRYRITDLRPPLQVEWITSGTILPPDIRPCADPTKVSISFDLGAPDGATDRIERVIVQITDADGITAPPAEASVAIHADVLDDGPPGKSSGLPFRPAL